MGKFLNKYKSWLLGLYWANIFIIYYFGPVQKWLFLTALVAIFFQTILANQGFLQDLISHDGIRRITVLLLCALPFYAYGHGVISADNIINGRSYKYLELTRANLRIWRVVTIRTNNTKTSSSLGS